MPHVIYLHSELLTDRIRPADRAERRALLAYSKWDCIVGLGAAGVVNLSMLCVAAALFNNTGLPSVGSLEAIHEYLGAIVGSGAALISGIALVASGFSSSTVGTYAGQIVMAGFMNWRIHIGVRRAITIVPSLAMLALPIDTTHALIYSQVILSFGIPFALIPLMLITSDARAMGDMVNRRVTSLAMSVISTVITALNGYLLFSMPREVL